MFEYMEQFSGVFNGMVQEAFTRNLKGIDGETSSAPCSQRLAKLLTADVQVDTAKLVTDQMAFMEKQVALWQNATKAMLGKKVEPVISESEDDSRFKDNDWSDNPVYSYLKQAYLLNAQMLQNTVASLTFSDPKVAEQVKFYTRQYLSSVSPGNYPPTNPEVCREILATQGKNLVKGMENFLRDLESSPPEVFKISQTDPAAFEVGQNLATTAGKVVYQNDLIQLIHYTPVTVDTYRRPVLITPPFINKYYLLDLGHKKSLVRWLVAQGYSVFMISWVNPDASLAHKDFGDYMKEGPLAALQVVEEITGADRINMVGYCVGGTLQATAAAYLRAQGDTRINSLTFLTTLLDFSLPGEIGHYMSGHMLSLVEQNADIKGVFDGRILGLSFSLLRENKLFWPYFINNYLKGKEPPAFDVLYWNGDATNVPAAAFKQYLRFSYANNTLKEPGGVVIDDIPIDLANIDVPAYFLSTIADHIVLWQATYQGAQLLSGPTRFTLAGSGHVAGVINPVEGSKYPHWVNDTLPESAETWFEGAKQCECSWWTDWDQWLAPLSGPKAPAISPGKDKKYPVLENAPGSYVKVRLSNG